MRHCTCHEPSHQTTKNSLVVARLRLSYYRIFAAKVTPFMPYFHTLQLAKDFTWE